MALDSRISLLHNLLYLFGEVKRGQNVKQRSGFQQRAGHPARGDAYAVGHRAGSQIQFEVRGKEIVITPLLPMSAYYGILKGYDLGDIEPPKEPDKDYE